MALATFPALLGLAFPVTRHALWSTQSLESISGRRARYPLRNVPRWKWEISFEFLRQDATYAEFAQLAGFYNACMGSANTFFYADPSDGAVTNQQFGVGDGATTQFQLVRTFGGFTEPVYAPMGAIGIYHNGANGTVAPTFGATGLISFPSPPPVGEVLTWTGSFNWICRFDQDDQEFQQDMSTFWSVPKLSFSSELL